MLETLLTGKRALVVGIVNEHAIATGCAMAFCAAGAELAITYSNERAKPYVKPVVARLDAPLLLPLDVEIEGLMEAVFKAIEVKRGQLDLALHSIAVYPKAEFAQAMDISVHSMIRMTLFAIPLMESSGSILTMSYYGSEKIINHCKIMGSVKSALDGTVRYLAAELGPKQIRVNAISPGQLRTRAGAEPRQHRGCRTHGRWAGPRPDAQGDGEYRLRRWRGACAGVTSLTANKVRHNQSRHPCNTLKTRPSTSFPSAIVRN